MRTVISALLLLLLVGCSSSTDQIDTIGELENVSRCFNSAHTVLQEGPETLTAFPEFLQRAGALASDEATEDANFSKLNLSDDGSSLETNDGQQIHCRIVDEQRDNYGESGCAFSTTYEFYIPDTKLSARTTVELNMP